MGKSEPQHRRNLFEVDNARNLSMQELVDTFIPTQSFWRLLSAKHHVLLGTRGHGKTAIVKMLSHNHLCRLAKTQPEETRVVAAIKRQEFIGIYVPTRLEWVGGLKNKPWLTERGREELFQWRLNLASCVAFLPIAESCLSTYVRGKGNQAKNERELAHQLSKDWLVEPSVQFNDLLQLRHYIEDLDYNKQIQILRERAMGSLPPDELPVGLAFDSDLFYPLRQGIKRLSRLLHINPNCSWLLCLDEAEFLEELDHRIINSHMRAFPDNLFFKVTTKPYCHHTLDTNTRESLIHGQDFEYVNMNSDSVLSALATGESSIGTLFGRSLFRKILKASEPVLIAQGKKNPLTVTDILGVSEILDPTANTWEFGSHEMMLLKKYSSKKTFFRAQHLLNQGETTKFRDQIGRKIHGMLLLREAREKWVGNVSYNVYSGTNMAIRCADGNPRRLLRIFNSLLMQRTNEQIKMHHNGKPYLIPPKKQTQAMLTLSASTLNQLRSLPDIGCKLHEFLNSLGEYMKSNIYNKPLGTDQITSIKIDASILDDDWNLIKAGVDEGFLYQNISSGNPDIMPFKEGVFRLAYILSPHFNLLPRRGNHTTLSAVRKFHLLSPTDKKLMKRGYKQLSILDSGENK